MPKSKRILVALDGSATSRRTVAYVADIVGGRPGFHVGLVHLELPPRMLEWGGAEDPKREERISSERAEVYREMENAAVEKGQALLQQLQAILAERGTDVTASLVQFEEPLDPKTITTHLLKIAAEQEYGTVVVGWHSFSGLRRLFRHHVGEELVRMGQGVTIWVVE
jgi:nucleotide-binding universal stress UspA family protein